VPTGGIGAAELAAFLALPNVLACGGSWMATPALVRDGRFDVVEELTREAVVIASEARRG
jgi:2-dehydro-3-deoxyphosphogluconate aldolase/(4S)-4-hydroxy-2-oxoglutarate aldolase